MKGIKIALISIGAVIVIGVGGALSFGLGIFEHKVNNKFNQIIQTDKANTNTKVFKNSEAYVDGCIRDLASYKREFDKAAEDEKAMIANMIDTKLADFDIKNLEGNDVLYNFLQEIRMGEWR